MEGMATCTGCQLAILDRYVFRVLEKPWHQHCLRCSDCHSPMAETCFSRDGFLLCRADFYRRYGTRCAGCDGVLDKEDLVRKAKDNVFHVDCFQCSVCHRKLDTGEQLYILPGNRFVCQSDFSLSASTSPATPVASNTAQTPITPVSTPALSCTPTPIHNPATNRTGSNASECGSEAEDENGDGLDEEGGENGDPGDDSKGDDGANAKRRGPRTTIKAKQLETLKNAFASTPKPTRHIREQLAQETGLNMRVIQVWFQNRRSKERRMKQLRFGGYRPSRRSRGGRDEICQDVYSHDGAPGFFPHPPMGFFCGDIYGNGERPPPGTLPPPFGMAPDGTTMMQPMSEGFDERTSPLAPLGVMMHPQDYEEDGFRQLPGIYVPDMKPLPLPSW